MNYIQVRRSVAWFVVGSLFAVSSRAEVKRASFSTGSQYLRIEVLDEDLMHFEYAAGTAPTGAIYTSPMILKTDYTGPTAYSESGSVVETGELRATVDQRSLCVALFDKQRRVSLSTICPADLNRDWKGLNIAKGQATAAYGLGQQFKLTNSADGDWLMNGVREEQPAGQAQTHGNGFVPVKPAGMVGNIQMPILYVVGGAGFGYALMLDNVYKQRWDFSNDPWQARMWGDQVRFYVMTGPDLPDLRRDFLELVGTPPVPPRKAFGLWVSEFGYKNWQQIDGLRLGLRRDGFPVDGFVLDLQWFGGVKANDPASAMGRLDWQRDDVGGIHFDDPDGHIASLAKDNVGLVAIEESYVSQNTDTYAKMTGVGRLLAYQRVSGRCDPSQQSPTTLSDWFGEGGMIDWSNPDAGAWVHENRRRPNLIAKGILGHWTDLGEPEKYDPNACYHGVESTPAGLKNQHGDIHNLYALLWNKSIYDSFVRNASGAGQRPLVLSRSGAAGSDRFGVAMWSGDIGSNLVLLADHLNAQMHMSFSGIDYYGADIGGFRREGIPYNENHSGNLQYEKELYTIWLANGAWFDVPIRPHTDNSFQQNKRYETAPDLVGDMRSNRENLRQRYELMPYYYSLAHRAFLAAEPLIPPLAFYYQNDPNVRGVGHEKLIGKDLLVAIVASHGEYARKVYLPQGRWANYHTRDWFTSDGIWIDGVPTYVDGVFRLPAFAKAGAILPMMYVDEQTKDVFGHRQDGTSHDELVVQVYPDSRASSFTLYEDDGTTVTFTANGRPSYATRTTAMTQQQTSATSVNVTIAAAKGTYTGASARRDNILRVVTDNASASGVTLNKSRLPQLTTAAAFAKARSGWFNAGRNLVLVKSGPVSVGMMKAFTIALKPTAPTVTLNLVCDRGWTAPGDALYAVGNVAALGSWDPAKGRALSPSVYYEYIYNPPPNHNGPGPKTPKWTGIAAELPPGAQLEWKCVKKLSSGQFLWSTAPNTSFKLPASGFAGTSVMSF